MTNIDISATGFQIDVVYLCMLYNLFLYD